jgi:hypothetical protein
MWLLHPSTPPAPAHIVSYLRQTGRAYVRTRGSWADCTKQVQGQDIVLEVPQGAHTLDYGRAVGTLIEDLARSEHRSAATVARDINSGSVDIIRLAIEGSATRDGRISVEAGLRAVADYPATELIGAVVASSSPVSSTGGSFVVVAQFEGQQRRIRIPLDESIYPVAINAHRDGIVVRRTGDLSRQGRVWELRNARDFRLVPGAEDT